MEAALDGFLVSEADRAVLMLYCKGIQHTDICRSVNYHTPARKGSTEAYGASRHRGAITVVNRLRMKGFRVLFAFVWNFIS